PQNVSLVHFCIRGAGTSIVDGKRIRFSQYDVSTTPPWSIYQHINDSNDLQVRLTYSNSALLEKLNVNVVDEELAQNSRSAERDEEDTQVNPFGTFKLTDDGA